MNRSRSIQIKAAFLVLVFSLNTIVGFACALGIDMGFNTTHHQDEEIAEIVHIHANGKKHIHHEKAHGDHHQKKSNDGDDNCCNKHVATFSTLDKSVPQSVSVPHPIFFTALISVFYKVGIFPLSQNIPNIKYFVRSHHPPIPNIRIAIRSFQI